MNSERAPGDYDPFMDEDYEGEDCFECGGEGWVTADCFEDTCCCADPELEHGIIPCPNCNPRGDLR